MSSDRLEVLNRCLSDRAIRANSARAYQTIADMAYGAWIVCNASLSDLCHLHDVVQIAEALAEDAVRRDL